MGRPPGSRNTNRTQFAQVPDARLQPAPTDAEALLAQLAGDGSQEAEPATDWQDMNDAPRDGRVLWLINPDGDQRQGYWRSTRKFLNGAWVTHIYWAKWRTGELLGFEPTGWHPAEGL